MSEDQIHIQEPDDDLMDTGQVADYLGIKHRTFTSYIYRGSAPQHDKKIRHVRLWRKETIDQWLKDRDNKSTTDKRYKVNEDRIKRDQ